MDENEEREELQQPEEGEPDYKALYEREKQFSQKWERLSKKNKAAADELEEIKRQQMTEQERLQADLKSANEKLEEATAKLEAHRKADERREWARKVSTETGVAMQVLEFVEADDCDDLMSKARLIAGSAPMPIPPDKGEGIRPGSVKAPVTASDWLRSTAPSV